jgi:3-isopropylmalate/(R)-2-methylmalate dehydratase small subunit
VKPFTVVTSRLVPLVVDNIDTDQIIPARFLKVTTREGLAEHLFEDLRRMPDGTPRPGFFMDLSEYRGAEILLAGKNFGCGSSREHAPWALAGHGFRVVVSTSFADIFYGNALKNGLLPLVVAPDVHARLVAVSASDAAVSVDLPRRSIAWPGGTATFALEPFAALCLQEGTDELGYILGLGEKIAAYESRIALEAGA